MTTSTAPAPQPSRSHRPSGERSMAPREHGAYGQLAFPAITAIACGAPRPAAVLLFLGEIAAFYAHEPVLVLSGQRGRRALREAGTRAKVRLVASTATALALGAAGLWLAPRSTIAVAAAPLALAALVLRLAVTGREKTWVGEIGAACAFGLAAAPVGVAAGLHEHAALRIGALWTLGLVASTISVRAVAMLQNSARTRAFAALAAITPLAVALRPLGPADLGARAALVLPVTAFLILLVRPSRRRMKRVGWTLVAASAVAFALAVWDAKGPVDHPDADDQVEDVDP